MSGDLNIRALKLAAKKIAETRWVITEDGYNSSHENDFKRYAGIRRGLELAIEILSDVEQELND